MKSCYTNIPGSFFGRTEQKPKRRSVWIIDIPAEIRISLKHLHLSQVVQFQEMHSYNYVYFSITVTYCYYEGRAIAKAVSRWLRTAAARVRARVYSSGICGGQSGAGVGFLPVLRFPLPIFIPPISPQSTSSIIWGLYNRPEVAAVPSGLSLTPLIIIIKKITIIIIIIHTRSTRRHIPEDGILHSHRRENLKSYNFIFCFV
jgi:hypothetical protein